MIFLLTGDSFQVGRSYKKLRAQYLDPKLKDFNFDLLEGKETTAREILDGVRTIPMMAPHRVVTVQEAEKIRKEELEKLEPHLETVPPESVLILLAEKIDKRLKFWGKLLKIAKSTEFRPLYPREVHSWVQEEVRSLGVSIEPRAVDWLVDRYGSELGLIAAELEKILLFLGPKKNIELKEIESLGGPSAWKSVFDLTDAIGDKKKDRAITLFHQMTETGESPVGLLALIARHFRILFKVKETGEGAPPYFLKNYQRQAAGFSDLKLKKAVDQIFETDWNLKRSPLSQKLLMEGLILKLCS